LGLNHADAFEFSLLLAPKINGVGPSGAANIDVSMAFFNLLSKLCSTSLNDFYARLPGTVERRHGQNYP